MAYSLTPKKSLPAGGGIEVGMGGHICMSQYKISASQPTPHYIDVAEWVLRQEFRDAVFTASGGCGSKQRRIVSCDWTAKIKIWYDSTYIGEEAFSVPNFGDTFELRLYKGWGPLYQYYTAITDRVFFPHYRAPMGVCTQITTVDNSEGDDVIWQEMVVKANSLMFSLNSKEDESLYDKYLNSIIYQIPVNNVDNPDFLKGLGTTSFL